MSDDFERRLHDAFRGESLPQAPASLVDGLQRVPDAPIRSRRSGSRRSLIGLLAAAVIIATLGAMAGIGGSLGPILPTQPAVVPSTTAADGLRLEYQLLSSDGFLPGSSDLTRIVSILEARIATTGVVGATVEAEGPDRIIVSLPGVTDAAPIRKLIGQVGRVDFVPLGSEPVTEGQTIDLEQYPPLFSGEQIASAALGTDQNGQPAVDFVLKPEGARLFGEFTSQNIGSYFAITVDGVVLTAPVIQNAIPGGEVQITRGLDAFDPTEVATIVAYLDSGALLFPLHEVGAPPAGPSPS